MSVLWHRVDKQGAAGKGWGVRQGQRNTCRIAFSQNPLNLDNPFNKYLLSTYHVAGNYRLWRYRMHNINRTLCPHEPYILEMRKIKKRNQYIYFFCRIRNVIDN